MDNDLIKRGLLIVGSLIVVSSLFGCSANDDIDTKISTNTNNHTEQKEIEEDLKVNVTNEEVEILKNELIELPDGQYLLPYEMVDGVKVFKLTAIPAKWEISKEKSVEAWTYNGVVPGPQIRIQKGDKVRVIFENKLPEDSVVHWHGVHIPFEMDGVPGVSQDPVKPGDKFIYEFEATNSGTHMYHTHKNTLKQAGKGLFGNFIIEDENEKVYDHEFTMMLSDGPLGFLINGKSFPDTKPWKVKEGDTVRVRISNMGNMTHPMHSHGHGFKTIAKDGYMFPEGMQYYQDNVGLLAGDRYDIVFTAKKGVWPFHCHVLTHVYNGKGERTGMIQLLVVE